MTYGQTFLFLFLFSLAFGLLPLKPEGKKTLAKVVFGQQTIHFMLRDEFPTQVDTERLQVQPAFGDLHTSCC